MHDVEPRARPAGLNPIGSTLRRPMNALMLTPAIVAAAKAPSATGGLMKDTMPQ